ncbi:hypothetical protein AB835_10465 [Candidatus Endobugula sertula]|uniref:Uncharacterized protein n=1 Tax=Candidatus Endobugula sertula TaxID=62101 RepID=A0A1D2QNI2_9GAMM|nr:hypothetical protein AB835_10465 [Candidatus Endobugula sertula]
MVLLAKLKYFLALPFLFLALWAVSWGVADFLSFRVLGKESEWATLNYVPSISEWENAQSLLERSMRLNSFNPNYPETMGRLYIWRLYVQDAPIRSKEEKRKFVNLSMKHLRSSIDKRPTWPLTWALSLETKSIDGQIDDEYWFLWDRARELGRWDRVVLSKLLKSGLVHWGMFTDEQRGRVVNVFVDMLAKNTTERDALSISKTIGALPFFCNILSDDVITKSMHWECSALQEPTLKARQEREKNPNKSNNRE